VHFLLVLLAASTALACAVGIASAFSFAIPKGQSQLPYIFSYNLGRIISYTIAGAITGLVGSMVTVNIQSGLPILQIISIVFLVLLALYMVIGTKASPS